MTGIRKSKRPEMGFSFFQDVTVDLVKNRILVDAPWNNGEGPALAAQVGGGRWSGKHKVWTYPADMAVCRRLRSVYGDRIDMTPALRAWAKEEKRREQALPALASAQDADLDCLPRMAPRLAAALRPYQRVGCAFVGAASRPGEGSLLADEPRTGKTIQAIGGILDRGEAAEGVHLIVCPRLSIDNVWAAEVRRWTDFPVHPVSGTGKQKTALLRAAMDEHRKKGGVRFVVVNFDMMRWRAQDDNDFPILFDTEWSSIIVDESHKVFGSLRVNKGTQAGNGLKWLELAPEGIRLAVTGTPFGKGGRVVGMFGTLHWLRPKVFTSFWRWADQCLEVDENDYGHKVVGGLKRGVTEKEFYASLGTVVLRRTRAEVMPWLPGKVYEDVYVDMTPAQAKQYRTMEREAAVGGLTALGALAELTRLKQFSNARHITSAGTASPTADSGKLPALLDRLDSHGVLDGSSNEKAIVFTQFEQFASVVVGQLRKSMGTDAVSTITGKVDNKQRTQACDAFQQETGGPRVMVMTTQTGGVSITLDRASSVHLLDEMWNPEDNTQAEDRAIDTQQDGAHSSVAVYYYRSNDTVEAYVRTTNEIKAADQHQVLDGRRGLAYARRLLGDDSDASSVDDDAAADPAL